MATHWFLSDSNRCTCGASCSDRDDYRRHVIDAEALTSWGEYFDTLDD